MVHTVLRAGVNCEVRGVVNSVFLRSKTWDLDPGQYLSVCTLDSAYNPLPILYHQRCEGQNACLMI